MANFKNLIIEDEVSNQQLTVYLNDRDRCYIRIGNDINNVDECEFITLDLNDLKELIKELNSISKSIVE